MSGSMKHSLIMKCFIFVQAGVEGGLESNAKNPCIISNLEVRGHISQSQGSQSQIFEIFDTKLMILGSNNNNVIPIQGYLWD